MEKTTLKLELFRNRKSFNSIIVCRPCMYILLDTKTYKIKEEKVQSNQVYVSISGNVNH